MKLKGDRLTIRCDLKDSNLFNCVLNNLDEEDLSIITQDPTKYESRTILNCLGAGIITCLRNQFKKNEIILLNPTVEFSAERNEQKYWRFKGIKILIKEEIYDELILKVIERCLKFIKESCQLGEKIELALEGPEDVEDFKQFKLKLLEMKDWLSKLNDDKDKRKELIDIFEKIAEKY